MFICSGLLNSPKFCFLISRIFFSILCTFRYSRTHVFLSFSPLVFLLSFWVVRFAFVQVYALSDAAIFLEGTIFVIFFLARATLTIGWSSDFSESYDLLLLICCINMRSSYKMYLSHIKKNFFAMIVLGLAHWRRLRLWLRCWAL